MLSSGYIQGKEKQSRDRRSMKNEDLLSNLPDELLASILSFMPTKDAIATSFLSLRWRNLWKFVRGIEISFSKDTLPELAASSTRELLSAIQSSKLCKVHVNGLSPSFCNADDLIGALVSFSLHHHVADVKLIFNYEAGIVCTNKSLGGVFHIKDLVRLQLHNSCEVTLPLSFSLPVLRTLVLDCVKVSREAVEQLICKCPSLHSFYFNASSVEEIKIDHSKLRYLVVLSSLVVGLRAPALKYLELDKFCVTHDYILSFMDVPALATCAFHSSGFSASFNFPLPTLWKVLLNDLHHVKTIHLDNRCIKGLSTTLVPTEERLGCTSIFIKITISRNFSVDALTNILPVFSRIEKLTIVLEEYFLRRYGYSTTWKPLVQVLSVFQQLKELEVHGFIFSENTQNYPTAAWTLIKLLTGKLQNIEKLTLELSEDRNKFGGILDKHIHKNVQNLRRASTFASVEFPAYLYDDTCLTMCNN